MVRNELKSILPHVEGLAKCLDADIVLLRVFETDFGQVDYYGHSPEFYEAIRVNYKNQILAYLAEVQTEHLGNDVRVRFLAMEGPVTDTILATAEREEVDLIAMASHGRTGLSRVLYGSVAAEILRRVERPLLLIRSERREKGSRERVKKSLASTIVQ